MSVLLDSFLDGDGRQHHLGDLSAEELLQWRGRRNRKLYELECYCPDCHGGAHIYRLARRDALAVRHNPKAGDHCGYVDFYKRCGPDMSDEHKIIASRIGTDTRNLTGWNAEPEQTFPVADTGRSIRPDVYAWHDNPSKEYHTPKFHEVQLSRQQWSETMTRTAERERALDTAQTIWWTPDEDSITLPESEREDFDFINGVLIDPVRSIVTGRCYSQLEPIPVEDHPTIGQATRRLIRASKRWSIIDDPVYTGAYRVLIDNAVGSTVQPRRRRATPRSDDLDTRGCDRPFAPDMLDIVDEPALVMPKAGEWWSALSDDVRLFLCPRCNRQSFDRFYGPCKRCRIELRRSA
jgi:hypothetical protein